MEQNYDTHNKELLAVFVAFKRWHHYLEGSTHAVDTVMDHKNLEYFTTTKKLTQHQVQWSKFLLQFNLKIHFRLGRLGAKPDALTCCWDRYSDRTKECNVQPIFSSQQVDNLVLWAQTSTLEEPDSRTMEVMDLDQLIDSIKKALKLDSLAISMCQELDKATHPEGWELTGGTLWFWGWLYVLDQENLRLQVIHNHYDHPSAGHFREARMLDLIHHGYHWLGLQKMVMDYVKSCTSCARAKAPCHKPYGKLKQLPIPAHPWSSISMDFIKQLPKSNGFSAILVIMDRLMKQVIFVPTNDTIDAPGVA